MCQDYILSEMLERSTTFFTENVYIEGIDDVGVGLKY